MVKILHFTDIIVNSFLFFDLRIAIISLERVSLLCGSLLVLLVLALPSTLAFACLSVQWT